MGDNFYVKSGEKIPADGIIIDGNTSVDESLISGESKPVVKRPGDLVTGSTMNISGTIEVNTLHVGEDSVFSSIIRLVENALISKSPLEKMVDRLARVFIPLVLTVALITACYLMLTDHDLESTLLRAITVLVIACPCALGMATPLAVAAGIGYGARQGILIKDGEVLQNARKVNTVVFDKTGTLTEGKFTIRKISLPEKQKSKFLSVLGSLEQYSNHPIGEAVVHYCKGQNYLLHDATQIQIEEGMGIRGIVGFEENEKIKFEVVIGNRHWLNQNKFSLSDEHLNTVRNEAALGLTVVYFGIKQISGSSGVSESVKKDQITGYLSLGDSLKPGVENTVEKLTNSDREVRLLSGDAELTTQALAQQAGISQYNARALPEEKIKIISQLQIEGKFVAMVGDGVNDAPALAQADIGVAMGGGTQLAVETAPITLLRDDLALVSEAIDISRRTVRTIYQNLGWAFVYNVVGIFIAVAGFLNPLMAASAMLISSLSVVGNSLRLREGQGKTSERLIEFLIPWREPT